jgi:hypothetical protein
MLLLAGLSTAQARDDYLTFPIKDAIAKGQTTKDRLDADVPLYFGKQKTPAVVKKGGEFSSARNTNATNKSDQEACEIAFVSAAIALQQRARREGGNAVINIVSTHPGKGSDTEYVCRAGTFHAGVGLRGTVATLKTGKK